MGFPGDTSLFTATQRDIDCYGFISEPYDVFDVSWLSSVPGVASVDENGLATAISPGNTTIRASWWVGVWHFDLVHGLCKATPQQLIANAACDVLEPRANRGRIQAQGNNPPVQKSRAWTQDNVPTRSEGLAWLDEVWNSLTPSEKRERQQAYEDAKRFIQNAPAGGYLAPVSRHFYDPQRKDPDARIDIEIITGAAFTVFEIGSSTSPATSNHDTFVLGTGR